MLDALISAGANLIGNMMSNSSKDDTNAMNMQIAQMNNATQEKWAQKNFDFQNQAAHEGVSWKVADALKAGIHPLAALGSQTFSPSPVSVNSSSPSLESKSWDFSSIGQDLGRAAKAATNAESRKAVDEEQGRKIALEKGNLENDILRAELLSKVARTGPRSAQLGPPMPRNVPGAIPLPRPGPDRTVSGMATQDDDIKQKYEDFPATKWSRPFGYGILANPYFGDGQSFEDRYGESEIASTLKWGVNTIADHAYTAQKYWIPEAYKNYDRRWLYNWARR